MELGEHLRAAGESVAGGAKDLVSRGVERGRSGAVASRDRVLRELRALPGPEAPAVRRWEFSVGALISRHPRVPGTLAGPLSRLDGLGGVVVGPQSAGFDGEEVPWSKVTRVQLHNGVVALASHTLDAEFERLRGMLPPVPGKKWGLSRVAGALTAVIRIAHERQRGRRRPGAEVACEIVYRGRLGRERSLRASLLTTAFLALRPDVTEAIVATAEAAGVAVSRPERRVLDGVEVTKATGVTKATEAGPGHV